MWKIASEATGDVVRRKLQCESAEILMAAAVEGTLYADDRRQLATHLVRCEKCRMTFLLTLAQLALEGDVVGAQLEQRLKRCALGSAEECEQALGFPMTSLAGVAEGKGSSRRRRGPTDTSHD